MTQCRPVLAAPFQDHHPWTSLISPLSSSIQSAPGFPFSPRSSYSTHHTVVQHSVIAPPSYLQQAVALIRAKWVRDGLPGSEKMLGSIRLGGGGGFREEEFFCNKNAIYYLSMMVPALEGPYPAKRPTDSGPVWIGGGGGSAHCHGDDRTPPPHRPRPLQSLPNRVLSDFPETDRPSRL